MAPNTKFWGLQRQTATGTNQFFFSLRGGSISETVTDPASLDALIVRTQKGLFPVSLRPPPEWVDSYAHTIRR